MRAARGVAVFIHGYTIIHIRSRDSDCVNELIITNDGRGILLLEQPARRVSRVLERVRALPGNPVKDRSLCDSISLK